MLEENAGLRGPRGRYARRLLFDDCCREAQGHQRQFRLSSHDPHHTRTQLSGFEVEEHGLDVARFGHGHRNSALSNDFRIDHRDQLNDDIAFGIHREVTLLSTGTLDDTVAGQRTGDGDRRAEFDTLRQLRGQVRLDLRILGVVGLRPAGRFGWLRPINQDVEGHRRQRLGYDRDRPAALDDDGLRLRTVAGGHGRLGHRVADADGW